MTVLDWTTLVALSLIFIFAAVALVLFFSFFFDGKGNPNLAIGFTLAAALVIAGASPHFSSTKIIPAAVIASSILIAVLSGILRLMLPNVDNKDIIKALKPILLFSMVSGILMAVFNLAQAIIA